MASQMRLQEFDPPEVREVSPLRVFDLRDGYAQWSRPAEEVAPPTGPVEISVIAEWNGTGWKRLPAGLKLKVQTGGSGFYSWLGYIEEPGQRDDLSRQVRIITEEDGRKRVYGAGGLRKDVRYRIRVRAGRYSLAYVDTKLVEPEAVALPPVGPIPLQPGLRYPFRGVEPVSPPRSSAPEGRGPTLLTGVFEKSPGALVRLHSKSTGAPLSLNVVSQAVADEGGRWWIAWNPHETIPDAKELQLRVTSSVETSGTWNQRGQFSGGQLGPPLARPLIIKGRQTRFPPPK